MHIGVIIVLALFFGFLFSRKSVQSSAEGEAQVFGAPLPEENYFSLRTENGVDLISFGGTDYTAVEGDLLEDGETWVWDWHGRMGEGIGFAIREGSVFPDGEIYTLRGRNDILLAFLPREGWPLTDMRIFLPPAVTLPTVRTDGFSFAEIFKIEGDFPDEEYKKIGDCADFSLLSSLAHLWQEGDPFDPPEGEYEEYRVRLYSSEMTGLYVNINVHRHISSGCFVVEKYRFSGDTLLDGSLKSLFLP